MIMSATCYGDVPEMALQTETMHEFLKYFMVATLVTKVFSTYIDYRQLKRYGPQEKIHPYLKDLIDKSTFKTS